MTTVIEKHSFGFSQTGSVNQSDSTGRLSHLTPCCSVPRESIRRAFCIPLIDTSRCVFQRTKHPFQNFKLHYRHEGIPGKNTFSKKPLRNYKLYLVLRFIVRKGRSHDLAENTGTVRPPKKKLWSSHISSFNREPTIIQPSTRRNAPTNLSSATLGQERGRPNCIRSRRCFNI